MNSRHTPDLSPKRLLIGVAVAMLIVLAVRLPLLRCGAFGADVPNFADEVNYVWLADSLASGNTVADTYWFRSRAPVTALLLLGLGALRGVPPEYAVCDFQVVQVVLWAALVCAIAAIAATLWDRRTALGAALLLALLPDAAMLTLLVYSETLFATALVVVVAALLLWTRQQRVRWVVLAGVAAGLGALARPTMLPLLPVFALWATLGCTPKDSTLDTGSQRTFTRFTALFTRLAPAALLVLTCTLVIAPWTIRNYRAYGGLIVIDTTGSVVLWSDNKPDGSDTVKDDIQLASTNPVERQRFATREALATIGADPTRFVRKVAREAMAAWGPADFDWTAEYWGDLLRNPRLGALLAQWHSVMLLTLPLALLGLLYAPHNGRVSTSYRFGVVGICVVYTCMIGITHFEERYRTPFMLLLLPYAAWSLAHPLVLFKKVRQPAGAAVVVGICLLGIVYSRNLWPDQWVNGQALALHGRGLARAAIGDRSGALADQEQAVRFMPALYDAAVAAANLRAAQGDERGAEHMLRTTISAARANDDDPSTPVIALQQLLIKRGSWNEADALDDRLTLAGRHQAEERFWKAGAVPKPHVTLGTSDIGLVRGFYLWETTVTGERFRWSRPQAELLVAGSGNAVCLRLNAARPPMVAAPHIIVSARGQEGDWQPLGTFSPPRTGWAWGCTPTPHNLSGPWTVRLDTSLYSPFLYEQGSDTRQLGVAVAEAVVRSDMPAIDPVTGLLLDHMAQPIPDSATAPLTLIGFDGATKVSPGEALALTLWWRGTQPPAPGTFTFVHLVDDHGATIAAYNAPLAGGTWPTPWMPDEPLADALTLPLPSNLTPGSYHLRAGAFDPGSGKVYLQSALADIQIK